MLPRSILVGQSAHRVDGARRAEREGADTVQLGHIFETRSHVGEPPGGLGLIRKHGA